MTEQMMAVRYCVNEFMDMVDNTYIPENDDELIELQSLSRMINDYRIEISWNSKEFAYEIKELKRMTKELDDMAKVYKSFRGR